MNDQTATDENNRNAQLVSKALVLKIIKDYDYGYHDKLKHRTRQEQEIIGSFLNVLMGELTKDIKDMPCEVNNTQTVTQNIQFDKNNINYSC